MGDARRLSQAKRAQLLAQLSIWSAPDTPEERHLLEAIAVLPSVRANMIDEAWFAKTGMRPGQCHQNCAFMEKNDPDRAIRAVTGWWKQPLGIYVHHSVINANGNWLDITPPPEGGEGQWIEFLPDPSITWVDNDGVIRASRGGVRVPQLVRADPQFVIDQCREIQARLDRGMDPSRAVIFADQPSRA